MWARDADSDRLTEVGLQIRAGHVVIDPLPREEEPLPELPAQAAQIDGRTLRRSIPPTFREASGPARLPGVREATAARGAARCRAMPAVRGRPANRH